jgi:murein tripeptide amidase MpaA
MKGLVVLSILLVFLSTYCLGEKKRYDGYKVLRIDVEDDSQLEKIQNLSEKLLADVWAINRLEGWIDVMVSPTQIRPFLRRFSSKVHIEDVQATLEEHYAEMANQTNVRDVFDSFPTTGQAVTFVNEQIATYPSLATRVVIGQTYLGKDILGVKLAITTAPKRTIYIHCTIHAREWITTTTCLWIIDQLLSKDSDGLRLIEKFNWIIIPIFNIDGYDYTHTSTRLWRKNRIPNSGSSCAGTDINRNYAYGWGGSGSSGDPCSETYRGGSAFSTNEARAERDFLNPLIDAGLIAAYFDIHSYGAYYMSAYGYTTTLPPAGDYNQMSAGMVRATNAIRAVNNRQYAYGASSRVLYISSGGTVDHLYGDGGIVHAYTIEAFGSNFTPPISYIRPIATEIWAGIKAHVELLS